MDGDDKDSFDGVNDEHVKSRAAEIKYIAEQAQDVYMSRKWTCYLDTHFHKIVLSGNVDIVREVIGYMLKRSDMAETLNWLIKAKHKNRHDEVKGKNGSTHGEEEEEGAIKVECQNARINFSRGIVLIVLGMLSTLCTPIFYFLHKFAHAVLNHKGRRISAKVQFPLVLAAMSGNEEMLELFTSQGVHISDTDEESNNIFHYIADISSESPDHAMAIFDLIMAYINDLDCARQMIINERNSSRLTAFEYSAKFGSPSLINHILKHPELLYQTTFSATKTSLSFTKLLGTHSNVKKTVIAKEEQEKRIKAIGTHLRHVDVTEYEAGSLGSRSTILNLLSDRNIVDMSEKELLLFTKGSCMWKWMNLKVKQVFPGVLCFQGVDMLITVLLLLVFNSSLWAVLKPNQEWIFELEVGLKEIAARANNTSYMFRHDRLNDILNQLETNKQLEYMQYVLQDPSFKMLVFNTTVTSNTEVATYFESDLSNWNLSDRAIPHSVARELLKGVILMTDDILGKFFMNFTYAMNLFAATLVNTKPELFRTKVNTGNRATIEEAIEESFTKFTFKLGNTSITPGALGLDTIIIATSFCVSRDDFNVSDIITSTDVNPPRSLYSSACSFIGIRNNANKDCSLLSAHEVYARKEKALKTEGIDMAVALLSVSMAAACIYILLDIIERWAFIYTCVADGTSCKQMIMAFLGSKLPGSYERKQFNVLTYLGIPMFFLYIVYLEEITRWAVVSYETVLLINNFIFVVIIILRIIMHIHATRLLPRIGHFVITTFMMGENLLHFSAIFGTILLIFSMLFHLLVENPKCSIEKLDGFQDLIEAMFSTFKLTFSLGDFGPTYNSGPVKFTYSIYVIIVGLLFMNLIIAVMSTTATVIMSDPWKEMTWQIEWLDEATSVEYTVCVLTSLLSRCCPCCFRTSYWHERAGYVVKQGKKDGESKICIELFDCSAVQ